MNNTATEILSAAIDGLTLFEEKSLAVDDFLDFRLARPELRRSVSHLLFSIFRHRKTLESVLKTYVSKPPAPPVQRLLLAASAQLFYCDRIAGASVVNVAVDFVKRSPRKNAAGFVNAVLRKVASHSLPAELDPAAALPDAVRDRWANIFPPELIRSMAAALLQPAANTFRCRLGMELSAEEAQKLGAELLAPVTESSLWHYYEAASLEPVLQDPQWASGRYYLQDPATAAALSLVQDWETIHRALDLCAAPGGKTLMIGERLPDNFVLIAADRSAKRQHLTRENLERWGISAETPAATPWELPEKYRDFDLVLADVPCSNTGVFRRRPDALWRYNGADGELLALQQKILTAGAERTVSGGRLLYSTCSIDPAENEEQIQRFLGEHPAFRLASSVTVYPDRHHDGAFGALLIRR